jgi:hypothetical protein
MLSNNHAIARHGAPFRVPGKKIRPAGRVADGADCTFELRDCARA